LTGRLLHTHREPRKPRTPSRRAAGTDWSLLERAHRLSRFHWCAWCSELPQASTCMLLRRAAGTGCPAPCTWPSHGSRDVRARNTAVLTCRSMAASFRSSHGPPGSMQVRWAPTPPCVWMRAIGRSVDPLLQPSLSCALVSTCV